MEFPVISQETYPRIDADASWFADLSRVTETLLADDIVRAFLTHSLRNAHSLIHEVNFRANRFIVVIVAGEPRLLLAILDFGLDDYPAPRKASVEGNHEPFLESRGRSAFRARFRGLV